MYFFLHRKLQLYIIIIELDTAVSSSIYFRENKRRKDMLEFINLGVIAAVLVTVWLVVGIYIWHRAYRRQYIHKGIVGWIFGILYMPNLLITILVGIVSVFTKLEQQVKQ